jgi:hypothetical protein
MVCHGLQAGTPAISYKFITIVFWGKGGWELLTVYERAMQ